MGRPAALPGDALRHRLRGAVQCASGGQPVAAPEHAREYSFGIAWSPSRDVALAVGRFGVTIDDVISTLTDQAVFTQYDRYAATNIVRGPVDPAQPGIPGPIVAVLLPTRNEGQQIVHGFDVDARVDTRLAWARAASC